MRDPKPIPPTSSGAAGGEAASNGSAPTSARPARSGHPAQDTGAAGTDLRARRASRRPEMIRQRREARLNLAERQRRQQLITRLTVGVIALLVVGIAVYGGVSYVRTQEERQPPAGVEAFPDPGAGHVEGPVAYAQTPPIGGEHAPVWQNCGYYPAPVASEAAVHSLEHGAVWITYRPDLPADQVDALRQLASSQTYILVSPFPDLPAPVVASSWQNQLRLDSANSPDLARFVQAYRQGPQTPEPGAACTNGTTATV